MSNNNAFMKKIGIVTILYALLYVILGTMAMAGIVQGILPGHESGEMNLMLFCYLIAVFGIICGGACIAGKTHMSGILGLIITIIAIISFFYAGLVVGMINIADLVAIVLGVAIYTRSRRK